jgi:hypothetical protein
VAAARGRPGTGGDPARVVIVAAGAPGAGPPGGAAVSRRAGQRLARAELSRGIYHPGVSLTERIGHAIARLLAAAQGAVPGGWWAVIALAALAVMAAAAILGWIGPAARTRARAAGPVLAAGRLSARDHRQEAERLAAAGDFAGAIVESVRAIAADLEERGVLAPRVARTADELAAEASRALPGHAERLREAARLFDDVRYGGRAGTAAAYRGLRDLDAGISAAGLRGLRGLRDLDAGIGTARPASWP